MLRSIWKGPIVVACAAVLGLMAAPTGQAEAQSRPYRSVATADIILGYVPPQEFVEAVGDLRSTDGELLLNRDYISAMLPLTVDATALAPAELLNVRTRCRAALGRPGCRARIRGEVALFQNRRGLIAHEIELQSVAPQN